MSDHLMRSQREDLKYADDEQKTLCCDRGKFLELICQFGLNLQVGVCLTTALTHLSTGNFILFNEMMLKRQVKQMRPKVFSQH